MRALHHMQRCEHVTTKFIDGALSQIPCEVRHHSRVDGKPVHLVAVTENRKTRFLCLEHAPKVQSMTQTVRRVKRSKPAEEQESLL